MNIATATVFPRFSRNVWLLSMGAGLGAGGFLGMLNLLKVVYILRLGYGPEFIGIVYATGALSFAAASVPGGALGGHFGPRRVMIAGAILNVVGMAILPMTEWLPEGLRPLAPLLAQVVSSSGWSACVVNQVPAVAAFTAPENRKTAYSIKEATTFLGMFLGTLIAGVLPAMFADVLQTTTVQAVPYRYALWVSVAITLTGLAPLLMVSKVPVVKRSPTGRSSRPPLLSLGLLVLGAFVSHAAVASYRAFSYAYMDAGLHLPTALVGTIASLGMLAAVPGALSSGRLARQRGSGGVMMLASIGVACSLVLMAFLSNWLGALLGTVGVLALSAAWMPAYQALQMELAPPEWRSVVAGAASMAMSLGFGTMSLSGGYIVAAAGYRRLFLIGAMLAITGASVMWTLVHLRQSPVREGAT